jgi:hypothetical protein
VATEATSRRGPVAGALHRWAALGLTLLLGVPAGTVALSACSGNSDVKVEGTSVEAPDVASISGTVVDAQGWNVQIVVTAGTQHFQTTATPDGAYTIRDVQIGTATLAWSATSRDGSAGGASVAAARRDGELQVGLTTGANHVDIQL